MTEPVPVVDITFDQLREAISGAGQTFELAVTGISTELSRGVQEILGIAALKLDQLSVRELSDARVRFTGVIGIPLGRGRTADVWIEARFMRAGSGLDYVLAFAPASEALPALLGDLRRSLDRLPIGVEGLWFTLSSIALDATSLEIPGRALPDVAIESGRSFLFRLKGQLLRALELDKAVFYLGGFEPPIRFKTKIDRSIKLGSLLALEVSSIAVNGADKITFVGKATFRLFDGELLFDAALELGDTGVAIKIPVPQEFIAPFNQAMFQPLMFSNAEIGLNGTLSNLSVSLGGDFKIKGSGHGGPFFVTYTTGNPPPIPNLFELESDRLTLSDVVTVMTGVPVALPAFLDRLVVLERTYLYYADRTGMPTRSGVPSVAGAKGHGDIVVLGYRGYGEFAVVAGGAGSARLLLAPIKFGRLVEIRGRATGSPQGFRGVRVGANAIQFQLDSQTRKAVASVEVAAFGKASVSVLAEISTTAITFDLAVSLPPPLGTTVFVGSLGRDRIEFAANSRIEIGVDADWGIGRMKIAKAAQADVTIKIAATPTGARGDADVRVTLGPLKFAFGLSFDPGRIDDLPEMIRKEVVNRALAALKDAATWLMALADGTIAFVEDAADAAFWIAHELRENFKITAEKAAALLKSAGYEFNRAYMIMNEIQSLAIDRVIDAMCGAAAYAEREAVKWVKTILQVDEQRFTALMVGEVLLNNGMSPRKVIEEVRDLVKDVSGAAEVLGKLERPVFEVVDFLQSTQTNATRAAEILVRTFLDIDKAIVKESLKAGGYTVNEATEAAENVFREAGRFAENVRDEARRTWRRFAGRLPNIKW
jgi:hypothetical protein